MPSRLYVFEGEPNAFYWALTLNEGETAVPHFQSGVDFHTCDDAFEAGTRALADAYGKFGEDMTCGSFRFADFAGVVAPRG